MTGGSFYEMELRIIESGVPLLSARCLQSGVRLSQGCSARRERR